MSKSFNLEAFKAGQKALTRSGLVATFVGICEGCLENSRLITYVEGSVNTSTYPLNGLCGNAGMQLVSMVSRHQHLIDSYDPEDTWQWSRTGKNAWAADATPSWDEKLDYRLHPHNDLIKAYKKGAKIEAYIVGDWVEETNPDWHEDTKYRIKPEPTIHCLAYDAKRFNHEQTIALRARVVKKEVAEANGWKIIQEWEV